jgi:hypothetical protein
MQGPLATAKAANDEVKAMNRCQAVQKRRLSIQCCYVPKECIRSVISIKND